MINHLKQMILISFLCGWMLTSAAQANPISAQTIVGQGVFYTSTGQLAILRGNNYVVLAKTTQPDGTVTYDHATLAPSKYNHAAADAAFAAMQSFGYNFVRITLDYDELVEKVTQPGALPPAFINNVVDIVNTALAHNLWVTLAGVHIPANYAALTTPSPPLNGDVYNADLLNWTYTVERAQYWVDLLTAVKQKSPAAYGDILGVDVWNEAWAYSNHTPFQNTTGTFPYANQNWDMSNTTSRQSLIDSAMLVDINYIVQQIKSFDSKMMVTLSTSNLYELMRPNFDGAWPLGGTADPRQPMRPYVLITTSNVDYIDIHVYPTALPVSMGGTWNDDAAMQSTELATATVYGKPIIMGEHGAVLSIYATQQSAGTEMWYQQANSCGYGFSGWSLYTWNTPDKQTGLWAGTDNSTAIGGLLSPAGVPTPCANIQSGFFNYTFNGSLVGLFYSNGTGFCYEQGTVYPQAPTVTRIPSDMVYLGQCGQ